MDIQALSERLPALAGDLRAAGAVLSSDAAAHAWIMAATGTWHGEAPRYLALPVRAIRAIAPPESALPGGMSHDRGEVVEVVRGAMSLYATSVVLPHGPEIPLLGREAILAQLLARGGAAIALAGMLVRTAQAPPIDPDVVREILKAARLGDRFQPLLELMAA